MTESNSIKGITKNIGFVFSSIGISRQKDGMTYLEVDYQGNSNLLKEALKDRLKYFSIFLQLMEKTKIPENI